MQKKKLPTIKEIAKKLNISASTVSRALHDHKSIGAVTTMRVRQAAEELGYEVNKSALFFKQQKTYTIGVIIPNLAEPFFSSALCGVEDFAEPLTILSSSGSRWTAWIGRKGFLKI